MRAELRERTRSRVVVVMRHSVRADTAGETWDDRDARPYDPPIVDRARPGAGIVRVARFRGVMASRAFARSYRVACFRGVT